MTYKKPSTLEELKANAESHPDRGKINGKPVVKHGSIELQKKIPKPLYGQLLCMINAFSISKSDAAIIGAAYAISEIFDNQHPQSFIAVNTGYEGDTTLFRGNIPIGLHESLIAILKEKGYNPKDATTIIVSCFVNKSERAYRKRLKQLKEEFNTDDESIIKAFKGESKRVAIEKKIAKLESGEELSETDKIKII